MPGEVLAVGWSILANIGGDRQITLQSAFAEDMSLAEKNAVLDEAVALLERQQKKGKRPAVLADLLKHRETLAQFHEDMGRTEAGWPAKLQHLESIVATLEDPANHDAAQRAAVDQLGEPLVEMQKQRAAAFNAAYIDWSKDPRHTGEYKPSGHVRANLDRMDTAIEKAKALLIEGLTEFEVAYANQLREAQEAIPREAAERGQALANFEVSVTRYKQAIVNLETELADIDKALEV